MARPEDPRISQGTSCQRATPGLIGQELQGSPSRERPAEHLRLQRKTSNGGRCGSQNPTDGGPNGLTVTGRMDIEPGFAARHYSPMRRLHAVSTLAAALMLSSALVGCSSQTSTSSTPSPSPTSTAGQMPNSAYAIAGGCGNTQLYKGGFPDWISSGIQGLSGMDGSVYAITSPATAVAFLLEYPLKVVSPAGQPSKVMWMVGLPRNGSDLTIDAHPLGSSSPTVHESKPGNAGPGEIYPDGIVVSSPGCWHLTLTWSSNKAEIDLPFES